MEDFFLTCADLLEKGEDLVMVTIIDHSGSTPRTSGSRMLVRRNGAIIGTIGGGIFEARAISLSQEVFLNGRAETKSFHFTANDLTKMDMVCGGSATILAYLMKASMPEYAALCRAISRLREGAEAAYLITKIPTAGESEGQLNLALLIKGREPISMPLSPDDRNSLEKLCKGRYPFTATLHEIQYRIEPICYPATVFIFGAGHVSQKLASLMPALDFRTVVLDDRAEYANKGRFPSADRIIVPENMSACLRDLPISKSSYVVIVTRGHAYDYTVLEQALQTEAGYIGMIGSKRKRETLYNLLRQAGVKEEQLGRVRCPIGISINAETPEEIAISIAAELIQVRAGNIND